MFKGKEIDLYSAYRSKQKADMQGGENRLHIAVGGLMVIMTIGAVIGCGYLLSLKGELLATLDGLRTENTSPEVAEKLSRHETLVRNNDYLSNKYEHISELLIPLTAKKQYSAFGSDIFLSIQRLCLDRITLTDITSYDLEITLEFSARNTSDISEFAESLRAAEIFSEIQYNGYTENSGVFDFTLVCTLTEEGNDE